MPEGKKAKIKNILQICVVVKDLQKSMETYWKVFGIGPWNILTFQPPALHNTRLHGKSESYSMKLALAQIGNVQWELIQPLTGKSTYQEFLDQKGEGLHHVACEIDDYDDTVSTLKEQGIGILMSGDLPGESFAYMDTEKSIGAILELYRRPAGFKIPPPEAVYPPDLERPESNN